jgi:hypothetical protein
LLSDGVHDAFRCARLSGIGEPWQRERQKDEENDRQRCKEQEPQPVRLAVIDGL